MNLLTKYPKTAAVGFLVLLVLLVSQFFSGRMPRQIKEDLRQYKNDLVWQAQALAGTLEPGTAVALMEIDYVKRAQGEGVYDRIRKALEAQGLRLVHMEELSVDGSRGWIEHRTGFPYAEYVRVARTFPDAEAVIALCGPPYAIGRGGGSDADRLPKLLVAGGVMSGETEDLFNRGWLYAATVPHTVNENGRLSLQYELLSDR